MASFETISITRQYKKNIRNDTIFFSYVSIGYMKSYIEGGGVTVTNS